MFPMSDVPANAKPIPTRRSPGIGASAFVLICLLLWLGGCQSAKQYREGADEVAGKIIDAGQQDALGRTEPFTIDRPSDTLRRRLLTEQELATSHPASLGSDQLEPIKHWPNDDYLDRERPQWQHIVEVNGGGPVLITLIDALQIAARDSRDYQDAKEEVFQTALALDLRRNEFRNTYFGALASNLDADMGDPEVVGIRNTGEIGVERKFKNGISVGTRLVVDLAHLLTQQGGESMGIFADISITIPLLAGAGEHIVAEPLLQAERNVLYAIWDFDRFRRGFAVSVASDYLSVLQQLDRVDNAEANYRSLIASLQRSESMAEAGRLSEIGVDQVRQDVLRARNNWISAREQYSRQLDRFKIRLGLPTDARIELDRAELTRLAAAGEKALGQLAVDGELPKEYEVIDNRIVLKQPSEEGVGPLELPEAVVVSLAFENRRDLQVTTARLDDSLREVVVAADALRPGLTVTVTGSAGERRSIGSATSDNGQLRFEEGNYGVGADFDFPWEKTAERNAYRNALIGLERQVRSLESLEDQIKLDLRNGLRSLREARESYRIQSKAVEVAQRRVDSTDLFLQAGRAQVRDLLEAQESLISAQNALTAALVAYRVTELELQRDMGVLQVDAEGLWQEYQADAETNNVENE